MKRISLFLSLCFTIPFSYGGRSSNEVCLSKFIKNIKGISDLVKEGTLDTNIVFQQSVTKLVDSGLLHNVTVTTDHSNQPNELSTRIMGATYNYNVPDQLIDEGSRSVTLQYYWSDDKNACGLLDTSP